MTRAHKHRHGNAAAAISSTADTSSMDSKAYLTSSDGETGDVTEGNDSDSISAPKKTGQKKRWRDRGKAHAMARAAEVAREVSEKSARETAETNAARETRRFWVMVLGFLALFVAILAVPYYQQRSTPGSGLQLSTRSFQPTRPNRILELPASATSDTPSLPACIPNNTQILASHGASQPSDRYKEFIALGPSWGSSFDWDYTTAEATFRTLPSEPFDRYPPFDLNSLFDFANVPEHCYRLHGDRGYVGVRSADFIFVRAVGVDQPEHKQVLEPDAAPRRMRVWGVVEGKENYRKWEEHRAVVEWRKREGLLGVEELEDEAIVPPAFKVKNPLVLLLQLEYDRHAPHYDQDFALPKRSRDHNLSFRTVVFEVVSNWGNPHFTTLYTLRVHGKPKYIRSRLRGILADSWYNLFSRPSEEVSPLSVRVFPPTSAFL